MRINEILTTNYSTLLLQFIIWVGVSVLPVSTLYSQSESKYLFDIQDITVEDGLPNQKVFQVGQDSKGFMWVSSYGYLSRYDGYEFQNYPCDFLGLTNNYALKFFIDANDNIWLSTSGDTKKNLKVFIPAAQKVLSINEYIKEISFNHTEIRSIYTQSTQDNLKLVWIVHDDGTIYSYDGKKLEKQFTIKDLVNHPLNYYDRPYLYDNHIYFSNKNTLFKYDKNGILKQKWQVDKALQIRFKLYKGKLFLFCSIYKCTELYEVKNDKLLKVSRPFKPCYRGFYFNHDKNNTLWISNQQDIIGLDNNLNKIFSQQFPSKLRKNKLKEVSDIFSDQQENLWCSTSEGILKILRKPNLFTTYLEGESIRGLAQIGDSLIVANYAGDKILHLKNQTLHEGVLKTAYANGIIISNDKRTIYATAYYHFKQLDIKTLDIKSYPFKKYDLYYCLQHKKTNQLFIATSNGFTTLNTEKDSIVSVLTNNNILNQSLVRYLYQNKEGIWAATDKGLFLVDENWQVLKHLNSSNGLPSNHFNYIYEDKNGVFWLGSRGKGLIKWDRTNNTFKRYGKEQGLLNENIYAVFEDDYGHLWLPSDYGLMRFNKYTEIINTYLTRDGLPSVEFNSFAFHQSTDGTLFLGGINGLIQFHPKDFLVRTSSITPLHITSYKVLKGNGETLSDLTHEVLAKNKIVFSPNDKLFELHFSLMDFINIDENNYAYKIEGYDNEWNYIEENFIRITGLPYGNYKLKIKGQGDKGQWSANVLELDLIVQKPFYLQNWFILFLFGVVGVSIFGWLRYRDFKHKKERIRLETEVTKRTSIIQQQTEDLKTLDKAKTRFFSNVTHELRTPLTLLIGPIEQMLKRNKDDWFQSQLEIAQRNGHQLLGLINQLLDISKLEAGQMKVTPTYGDLVEFLAKKIELFEPLAQQKRIDLSFNTSIHHWETSFDKIKLTKIINNLLSNALKFTPSDGKVFLSLDCKEQNFQIQVEDTGVGISEKKLPYIYNRFYQIDSSTTREGEGTGIGLALVKELVDLQEGTIEVVSEKGIGTLFTLTLPTFQNEASLSTNKESLPFVPSVIAPESVITSQNQAPSEKLIILVIEDNKDMRTYIRSCLNDEVYQIIEAPNGKIGIEKTFQIIPDLIISDVMMPIMDGFEVSKHLREDIRTSHIPIILLTAKTAIDSRLKGFESGIDAYMTKPFNVNELRLRINKLIELRLHLQDKYKRNGLAKNNGEDLINEKENQFISDLKNIILNNLSNPTINGDYLGKQIGLSRMQLYRKLKALTDKTITQFIKEIRLAESLTLLKQQEMNVSEVAYTVGFNTPTQFSKAFKKKFGIAPSKVKKA